MARVSDNRKEYSGDALLQRLQALEAENARLRQSTELRQSVTAREDEYKGNPILTFEGPFRPFSLGLTKLRAVKACVAAVDAFLSKHENSKASQPGRNGVLLDRDDQI